MRDKLIEGELDAAQAPATLPFLASLGVDSDPCACVSGLVLSLEGNGIVLSRELWEMGIREAAGLKEEVHRSWGKRTYTFGVPFAFSCQDLLLRRWLRSGGLTPDAAVRVVSVPPEQMFATLKLGYIHGYCAGEPWITMAEQAALGDCVATSEQLAPRHPEKVLMVRQSFASGRAEEHERLVGAVLEACSFCEQPENWEEFCRVLAHSEYVNAPVECFSGFEMKSLTSAAPAPQTIFSGHDANRPTDEKALWLMQGLYEMMEENPFLPKDITRTPVLRNVFRCDIFERARGGAAARPLPTRDPCPTA